MLIQGRLGRRESNLMHFKREVTWTHGNTFETGQRVNSHFVEFIRLTRVSNVITVGRCLFPRQDLIEINGKIFVSGLHWYVYLEKQDLRRWAAHLRCRVSFFARSFYLISREIELALQSFIAIASWLQYTQFRAAEFALKLKDNLIYERKTTFP